MQGGRYHPTTVVVEAEAREAAAMVAATEAAEAKAREAAAMVAATEAAEAKAREAAEAAANAAAEAKAREAAEAQEQEATDARELEEYSRLFDSESEADPEFDLFRGDFEHIVQCSDLLVSARPLGLVLGTAQPAIVSEFLANQMRTLSAESQVEFDELLVQGEPPGATVMIRHEQVNLALLKPCGCSWDGIVSTTTTRPEVCPPSFPLSLLY
jgi:hypothetical protein